MALIVEDGSIVPNANSYITAAQYISWADSRFGASRPTAPADETAAEPIILRGMDAFEGNSFQGSIVSCDQELQWPRYNVRIDGCNIDSDAIPKEVPKSLYEYCYAQETGSGALKTIDRKTTKEKVDVI